MSIDLSVIFSHPFDNSNILSLPDQLNADKGLFNSAMSRYETFVNSNRNGNYTNEHHKWMWSNIYVQRGGKWAGITPEDIWTENGQVMLIGPSVTIIHFGRTTCEAVMFPHWNTFVIDPNWQQEIRRACYGIAHIFQSSRVIYHPDSSWETGDRLSDLVIENYTFEQIETWLRENIGQPVDAIESIDALEIANPNGTGYYFIDDFADMKEK